MTNLVNQIKIEDIALAVEYNYIRPESCLIIKKNDLTDIKMIDNSKLSGKIHQGYIECVSSFTLNELLGSNVDTSEDGLIEAEKIYNWMKNQK